LRRSAFQHASALRPPLVSTSARRLRRLVSKAFRMGKLKC
jgi:hypothetical protein